MALKDEEDYPKGHPARFDYNPDSPEARRWKRKNSSLLGERDFPVDHPKAIDTPGNNNSVVWKAGEDPFHPELEPHTGRPAHVAARVRELQLEATKQARESVAPAPIIAPQPPAPGSIELPSGQPGG